MGFARRLASASAASWWLALAPTGLAAPEPPQAIHGAQVAQTECGKGGYGVAECPEFGGVPEPDGVPEPGGVSESPPKPAAEECQKSGYGVAECHTYGGVREPTGELEPPPKPPEKCRTGGYGVTECF